MIKNPSQRVGVFIDVQNLYYSAKNLYNAKVNFGKILEKGVAGRQLIRAFAYVIRADIPEEQSFFDALTKAGFEVKSKDIQVFAGGAKKGDWDVGIVIDMIRMGPKLDVIVLVSGDGDYAPALEYLRNQGHLTEVFAFGKSTSAKLISEADEFTDLDENSREYLIAGKKHGYRRPYQNPEKPTLPEL
ncbi:MAG TPA: NYN domain-containing protein [Candidatus Saccharimonadales bacterium]|nr:NYN domain-containing protein [Candidatus Saccharimonadales bacterium]